MTLYLWFCVEFLKFCIFSFFVMDWFFVVSTSLFKGAFTDSAMHLFSFIVSLFVHYVGNVALIRRRVSGLFVQLQLFFDYFFIFIDNWFDICTKLFFILFLLNISRYFWLLGKWFWIIWRKYLQMLFQTFFEKCELNQMMFLLWFEDDLFLFLFWLFGYLRRY